MAASSALASLAVRSEAGVLVVGVRVRPSAPRTAMQGVYGDRLKVAVGAPPEDNRANHELAGALAGWLGLRRVDVRIASGHGSRDKMVAFTGISEMQLRSRLAGLLDADRSQNRGGLVDREALNKRLLEERERLNRELAVLDADLAESLEESSEESPYDQHMAETAAVTLDREMDLTLQGSTRAALAQVDRALARICDGTYGTCEACGRPIGEARLSIAPHATLCVDCKRRDERSR